MILAIMMEFYRRARDIIRNGAPLAKLVNLPCREDIVRIKTTHTNEDLAGITGVETRMNQQLDELDRLYRKAELA